MVIRCTAYSAAHIAHSEKRPNYI